MDLEEGRKRVVIEGVSPEIDGGDFAVKRTEGEKVVVEADIFTDSHDLLTCVLLFRKEENRLWNAAAMEPLVNDRWRGAFQVGETGRYRYTIKAWVDPFKTWRRDLRKKMDAGADISVDLLFGRELIEQAVSRADDEAAARLKQYLATLAAEDREVERVTIALGEELAGCMEVCPEKEFVTAYDNELPLVVEREKARFSTWYEMFPRSCAGRRGDHGTFEDCERILPYVAS
ncbi:MAG: maltotransferase domain-containing protein, partial [Desulfatiglandales bacterium]